MKELGVEAGVTAEAISRFEAPARKAGSSLESVAAAMFRMSGAAVEARDPTTKAAAALKAIGISAADLKNLKPDEMFELVARRLAGFNDGLAKNAAMQVVFSKSGREMNRVVEQIAESGKLAATVTNEQAEAAKKLDAEIVNLKMESEKLWRSLVSDAVPGVTKVIQAFIEARREGGLREGTFAAIATAIEQLHGGRAQKALDDLNDRIKAAREAAEHPLQTAVGDVAAGMMGMRPSGPDALRDAAQMNELLKERVRLESLIAKQGLDEQDARAIAWQREKKAKEDLKFDPNAAAGERMLAEARKALALATGEAQSATGKLMTSEKKLLELAQDPAFKALGKDTQDRIAATLNQAAAQEKHNLVVKAYAEQVRDAMAEQEKMDGELAAARKVGDDHILALSEEIERYKLETEAIGKTNLEREIELLDYRKKLALEDAIGEAQRKGIEQQYEELKALAAVRDARQQALGLWQDIADRGSRLFADLATSGKNAFDVLKNALRDFAKELIAFFAKKFILQVGASALGGTAAGGALGAQAASLGQNTLTGALGNSLGGLGSSMLGGAGSFIAGGIDAAFGLGGAFSAAAGAGFSAGVATLGIAAEAGAAAVGGMASVIGAAIPVIGWIVAIGAVLYSVFGSSGGGPKGGGSWSSTFDTVGRAVGPTPGGRFFTPDNADSQVATAGRTLAQGFYGTLAALGGTTHGVGFRLGFDTDPNGTAQNRVSGAVYDAQGNPIFMQRDRDIGRDQSQIGPEMQLEASRMLLAALQSSELPAAIHQWLSSIDASAATQADIERILKGADALHSLMQESANLVDVINGVNNAVDDIAAALKQMDRGVETARINFENAFDAKDPEAFLAAEQSYRQAVLARYNEEVQAVRNLQNLIRQINEQAYQFALNIAQRINAVGGSRDIGAMALGRAGDLRGMIGGNDPISVQIENVQGYVAAVDTWYQARRAAIENDIQAQQQAAQAIAQAQQAAAQARVQQLQQELALTQQWAGVMNSAKQQLDAMRLTAANPLAASGRLALSSGDVEDLFGQFQGSKGAARVALAQQLLPALQTQLGLLQETSQRPSDEYMSGYNSIVRKLVEVRDAASIEADKGIEIQQQILDVQSQAAAYAAMSASAGQQANGQLAALDGEARGYYEWAEREGARLYAVQRTEAQAQLTAITGGLEPNLFIAQRTTEMRDLLSSINDRIQAFLDAIANGQTTPPGGNTTTGGPPGSPTGRGGSQSITINVPQGSSQAEIVSAVVRAWPYLNRLPT